MIFKIQLFISFRPGGDCSMFGVVLLSPISPYRITLSLSAQTACSSTGGVGRPHQTQFGIITEPLEETCDNPHIWI